MPKRPYATRQYDHESPRSAALAAAAALQPGRLYRFFMGRDLEPVEIDPAAVPAPPTDPFWTGVLAATPRPVTIEGVLAALPPNLQSRRTFVVGDGSQIPWTPATRDVARELRIVVACGTAGQIPAILISTAPRVADSQIFLQVIAWDEQHGAHQFYDRRAGSWIWAGSSWEALSADTRGRGPFDSHVNGALNMKELEAPWLHWHSMSALVQDDVLAPDDPFRSTPLWTARSPAHELELEIVRPGIIRWTAARIDRSTSDGLIRSFPELFRQLTHTTTVNLVTSPQESRLDVRPVLLPLSGLIDRGALIDTLDLAPDIEVPEVPAPVYQQVLRDFDVKLTDGAFIAAGDTHFAFAVPARAFEDLVVLRELISRGVLSQRFAAALFMVDFTNPVFSTRREALDRYAPKMAIVGDSASLEAAVVAAIRAAGQDQLPGTPEAELMANLGLSDDLWRAHYERRIEAFFAALRPQWSTVAGFSDLFRVAESRRREFRKRPLAEFELTLAVSNIPSTASLLRLTETGALEPK